MKCSTLRHTGLFSALGNITILKTARYQLSKAQMNGLQW